MLQSEILCAINVHHSVVITQLLYFEWSPSCNIFQLSFWHIIWKYALHVYIYIHRYYTLTFFLAYTLTFCLKFFLTFYLTSILTYFLAYIVTFFLAYILDILSGIWSDILSSIYSICNYVWHSLWHVFGSMRGPQHPKLAREIKTTKRRRRRRRRSCTLVKI